MPTDSAAANRLAAVAQNAAKAWLGARVSWSQLPVKTPLERALAAEAYVAVGECKTASSLIGGVELPAIAAPWLKAVRDDIGTVAQAQQALRPPYTLAQISKLLAARQFDAVLSLLEAKPDRSAADEILLADIRYRAGDFNGAVALGTKLLERELEASQKDKLERLLKNGSRRVAEDPAASGALAWALRHTVIASAREHVQAKQATDSDVLFLLDVSRCLGAGDLIRDVASPRGYFTRDCLMLLFGQPSFAETDLRLLLGSMPERSTREKHDLASALIATNHVALVPGIF